MPRTSSGSTPESGSASASSGSEQSVSGITETGQDITLSVELPVQSRAVNLNIWVRFAEMADAFGGGHETGILLAHAPTD